MTRWRSRQRDERGVALVTVLFVGAVMTVTVTAAAFIAVQEFRAANRDRGATSALALSEAGIDRTIQWMRSNKVPWRYIVLSGCAPATVDGVAYETITLNGQIGNGTYSTVIRRADDCAPVPTSVPSPRVPQQMILESTGCTNNTAGEPCPTSSSKRVVRQAVAVSSRALPVGMSGARVDLRGSPTFRDLVLIARGIVNTRRQVTVLGTDPYYKKSDFYPCTTGLSESAGQCFDAGSANDAQMPASIHSTDRVFLNPNGLNEHPPNPNCSQAQFLWDGSATGGAIDGTVCGTVAYPNRPPTSLFTDIDADRISTDPRLTEEDHLFFKEIAQQQGLYCSDYGSAAARCVRGGTDPLTCNATCATISGDIDQNDVAGLGNYFVVYIEFPDGSDPMRNMLGWDVESPAPTDPCDTTVPANTMIVTIVRNGGFETKTDFMGAIFAEDGVYDTSADTIFEGTIAANLIRTRGSPTICNSQRWVDSVPGVFIQVVPLQWSEVDR